MFYRIQNIKKNPLAFPARNWQINRVLSYYPYPIGICAVHVQAATENVYFVAYAYDTHKSYFSITKNIFRFDGLCASHNIFNTN